MDMIQIIFGDSWYVHSDPQARLESLLMSYGWKLPASVVGLLVSLSLWAAEKQHEHTPAMKHSVMIDADAPIVEGGQATFAALIEMVALLERDSETDWASVDIDALREHLLDMNYLMMQTEATKSIIGDTKIQFTVRGTVKSVPSIHRMVPAHSRYIGQSRNWAIEPELNNDGAMLTITVDSTSTLNRLYALGFYGFMSLDSHHENHHYLMAIGQSH